MNAEECRRENKKIDETRNIRIKFHILSTSGELQKVINQCLIRLEGEEGAGNMSLLNLDVTDIDSARFSRDMRSASSTRRFLFWTWSCSGSARFISRNIPSWRPWRCCKAKAASSWSLNGMNAYSALGFLSTFEAPNSSKKLSRRSLVTLG